MRDSIGNDSWQSSCIAMISNYDEVNQTLRDNRILTVFCTFQINERTDSIMRLSCYFELIFLHKILLVSSFRFICKMNKIIRICTNDSLDTSEHTVYFLMNLN
jgi:hypothetical protein